MKDTVLADQRTDRAVYFDFLRIVAAFAVMTLHVSAVFWREIDVRSFAWKTLNFYDSIVRWGVPVFTMISGALFLRGSRSMGDIYKKNILRIVIAFVFWSLIYAAEAFAEGVDLKGAILEFIIGRYHLWFLFMIVGLYMIVPFLRAIVKNESLTKYFLVLAGIFTFALPQGISILSVISEEHAGFLQSVIDQVFLHLVLGYSAYFILGDVLHRLSVSGRMAKGIYILGACGFFATILGSDAVSNYAGAANDVFLSNFTINVLCEAVCVFVLCKNLFSRIRISEKAKRWIYRLSKYSFGAYLVHVLVIDALDRLFGLNALTFHPVAAVPVISIIVFCASFLISAALNHIPVLNRYIV